MRFFKEFCQQKDELMEGSRFVYSSIFDYDCKYISDGNMNWENVVLNRAITHTHTVNTNLRIWI